MKKWTCLNHGSFNPAHAVTGWTGDETEPLASDPTRWTDQATSVCAVSEELLPQATPARAPPSETWQAQGLANNGAQQVVVMVDATNESGAGEH